MIFFLEAVSFAAAQAMRGRVPGEQVTTSTEFSTALRRALGSRGPYLIEASLN
jgi:thiamine pyrophosphate-dependent acetolactate synthase large subunit-like protein